MTIPAAAALAQSQAPKRCPAVHHLAERRSADQGWILVPVRAAQHGDRARRRQDAECRSPSPVRRSQRTDQGWGHHPVRQESHFISVPGRARRASNCRGASTRCSLCSAMPITRFSTRRWYRKKINRDDLLKSRTSIRLADQQDLEIAVRREVLHPHLERGRRNLFHPVKTKADEPVGPFPCR